MLQSGNSRHYADLRLNAGDNIAETGKRMRFPNAFRVTLALLLSAGAACFAQGGQAAQARTDGNDAKAWFAKGQAALQSGDLDAAEKAFREVLARDPNAGASVYANLGVIGMRRRNWDEALKNLQKAEKLAPRMTGVRLDIGLAEFRRGNYLGAIAPLQSVLRDEPGSGQARYLLGMCQVFTDRFADGAATLEPLWSERSGDVMYLYVLGIAASKAGNKELDERAMKRLLEVGGDTPEFHLILGKAYLQHQEYDTAFAELRKAEAAAPDMPFVHFNLGIAYEETGKNDNAAQEFLRDIPIDPDLPDNYYQLGKIYAQEQKLEEAERAYKEVLKRDPHRPGAWFGLAKIYQRQEKYEEALQAVEETLKVVPESDKAHYLRAQLLQKLGRREEASAEFARAKKLMDADLDKDREKWGDKQVASPEVMNAPN